MDEDGNATEKLRYEKLLEELETWKVKMERMRQNVQDVWVKVGGDANTINSQYATANTELQNYYDKTKLYYMEKIDHLDKNASGSIMRAQSSEQDGIETGEVPVQEVNMDNSTQETNLTNVTNVTGSHRSSRRYSVRRLNERIMYSAYLDTYY